MKYFSASLVLALPLLSLCLQPISADTAKQLAKPVGNNEYPGVEWKPTPGKNNAYPGVEWEPKPETNNAYPGVEWKPKPETNNAYPGVEWKPKPMDALNQPNNRNQ